MKYFILALLAFASSVCLAFPVDNLDVGTSLKLNYLAPGSLMAVSSDNSIAAHVLAPADFPASGVTPATYGDATHVPQIVVDAKGRVTTASNVAISGGSSQWVDSGSDIYFSAGKVGIGVAPTLAGLQVYNAVSDAIAFQVPDGASALVGYDLSGIPRFSINTTSDGGSGGGFYLYDYGAGSYHIGISQFNGDVGIGIGSNVPVARLELGGGTEDSIHLNGSTSGFVGLRPAAAAGSTTYILPSSDGTSGQQLSTDGAGNLSWATGGGSGTVTSVGTGTGLSGGPVTTTGTISLANTAVTPGTYGSATQSAVVTVDAQGRLTAASAATISVAATITYPIDVPFSAGPNIRGDSDTGLQFISDGLAAFWSNNVAIFSFSPSGITSTVPITAPNIIYPAKTAHEFLAGPTSGSPAIPFFRTIQAGDIDSSDLPSPIVLGQGGGLAVDGLLFDSDTGLTSPSDGIMDLYANNVKILHIEPSLINVAGNVGVSNDITTTGNYVSSGAVLVSGDVTTAANINAVDGNFSGNISAANYPPPPPTGSIYTVAGYDGAGALSSVPNLAWINLPGGGGGLNTNLTYTVPNGPGGATIHNFYSAVNPAQEISQDNTDTFHVGQDFDTDADGFSHLQGNLNAMSVTQRHQGDGNVDGLRAFVVDQHTGSGASTGTVNALTAVSLSSQVDPGSSIGGGQGIQYQLNAQGAINGNWTDLSIGSATSSTPVSGDATGVFVNAQLPVTQNKVGLNLSTSGDVGGSYSWISGNHINSHVQGNSSGIVYSIQNTSSVSGDNTMIALQNNAPSTTFTGIRTTNAAAISNDLSMVDIQNNAATRSAVGMRVSMQGNSTAGTTGINIDVQNATSTNESVISLGTNGGAVKFNSNAKPKSGTGVYIGNFFTDTMTVDNGSPLTGTDFLGTYIRPEWKLADTVAMGPNGLGLIGITALSETNFTGSFTQPIARAMLLGTQIPGTASGATLTDWVGLEILGLASFGGSLTNVNRTGIRDSDLLGQSFCNGATGVCKFIDIRDPAAQVTIAGKVGIGVTAPSSALQVSGDASISNTLADDTAGTATISQVSSHMAISGDTTVTAHQTSATQTIDAGAVNGKTLNGTVNTVTRGNGADDGESQLITGTTNLIFANTGSGGVIDEADGYVNLFFAQNGTTTKLYDFHSVTIPAGSGTIGTHYGVYIEDSPFRAKNFLSGTTQLGGSSYSASTDATLALKGVGAFALNSVTTADKLSLGAENGWMVYDSDIGDVECYQSGSWGSCAAGGGGANVTLSNLTTTNINADFIFNTGATAIIKTKNDTGPSQDITMTSGDSSTDITGSVRRTTGTAAVDQRSGDIEDTTANATGTGNSGHLFYTSGNTVDGGSGAIHQTTGSASGTGSSGSIIYTTGSSNNGVGGITFVTGNSTGFAGGNMTFVTGFGTGGHGGNMVQNTGDGDTTSPGGNWSVQTGNAGAGQQGGNVSLTGGAGGAAGGFVQMTGGACTGATCGGASAGLTGGGGGAGGSGGPVTLSGGGTSDGAGNGGGVQVTTSGMSTGIPGDFLVQPGVNNSGVVGNFVVNDAHWASGLSSASAPTAAPQSSAGTGSTCTLARATDTKGEITIGTGTIGLSTGSYCRITFDHPYASAPVCVLGAVSTNLAVLPASPATTTYMDVSFGVALGISASYVLNFHCLQ